MYIAIQNEDFDVTRIIDRLRASGKDIGAIATFTGLVRDQSTDQDLIALELEHYPGMTEKALKSIAHSAMKKWEINDLVIIHRVGRLKPADNIVIVAVASAHRKQAFNACEYLMDFLKTQAPFWKKEITKQREKWVEAKESDKNAAELWK